MAMPEKALAQIDYSPTEYVPSVAITIDQAKQNFQRLQQVTKELMKHGIDYDTIPGTPKPTLLKPGAEHLLQFFGLGHKVQRVEAKEDWEVGFFYYCYKVTVFKARPMPDGTVYEQVIAECEGSANSKEKRYRNQDVYTIVNTLQKMAIKRALVGATLQATGTSGMFTQDLDDMDLPPESQPMQQPKPAQTAAENSNPVAASSELTIQDPEAKATKAHYNTLYNKANERKVNLKKLAKELFGDESLKNLKQGQIKALYDAMQNNGLNWTSFWTKVKGELGYKENEVHEIAGAYFMQEVKSLTDVIKTQEALDQFLDYLQNLAKEEITESDLPWQ